MDLGNILWESERTACIRRVEVEDDKDELSTRKTSGELDGKTVEHHRKGKEKPKTQTLESMKFFRSH